MNCLTCQWKLGEFRLMDEVAPGVFSCGFCHTTKSTVMAAPVLMVRSGITSTLYMGGFVLLLLASILFTAFPEFQVSLTWTMLYSLYLVYFGLAFANFRRHIYV